LGPLLWTRLGAEEAKRMSRDRVLIALAVACLLVAAGAVGYGAGKGGDVPEVVRAQAFELVDEEGKARAVLGLGREGAPNLDLKDANGLKRATLALLPDGSPVLVLNDARGEERATLTGGPSLTMRDKTGGERAALTVRYDGSPSLVLRDGKGEVISTMP